MSNPRSSLVWLLAGFAAVALAGAAFYAFRGTTPPPPPLPPDQVALPPDLSEQVHNFCGGACHAYPPAETFPRRYWKTEVERGFRFFEKSGLVLKSPRLEHVIRYYEDKAPEELPDAVLTYADHPLPLRLERVSWSGPEVAKPRSISFIELVRLGDPNRPELLACDMQNGEVMLLAPRDPEPKWRVIARLNAPAHAEVIDLDGDGIKDLLVADLGQFMPTERRCGSVVWLRGKGDGTFTPIKLLDDVGRVADVQAAHFRGKDKLDLVVASFGLNQTGELIFLENQTTDWSKPQFVKHVLEAKTGALHVPVADLNGDGRPDFVCLFSQEHEQVVGYVNEGDGKFRAQKLWSAPHPGYGSSGIQLVDLDGDGDLDVLYTNGDVLDEPYLFKPYHGVQWLENTGGMNFVHHPVAPMYGVHRAVAGNFTGSGKADIVAVSFLPADKFAQRKSRKADSIVVMEQTAKGKFARHSVAQVDCDHVVCVLADVFGTGRLDLVVGNFGVLPSARPVEVWRNLGRK